MNNRQSTTRAVHLSAIALWSLLALPLTTLAGIPEGTAWLATQQNPNGSFGNTATSLATPVQSTAEVLRAYQAFGQQSQPGYANALGFLNSDTESNTEYLARKIIINAAASNDVTTLVNALVANQNSDGGFGNTPGDASAVFDTALALGALAAANFTSGPIAGSATGFLLARRQANGGWLDGANGASVPLTAHAFRALFPYRNAFAGVSAALLGAQNYLLSQRTASNTWNESFETALALQALISYVSDLALIDASAVALGASQLADGSWVGDAYTTALALQAIQAYQVRKGASPPPTTGAVSGYVVRAGSSEPIAGAQVSVVERPGVVVLSDGSGYFLIPGLPVGNYTVSATKGGYLPASIVASAVAAQTTLAGNIVLGAALDTGLLKGKVFDASNLTALPGAAVTIAGAVNLSVVTDGAGTFSFGALSPGNYAFSIVMSGYETVSATVTVTGGQALSINQGLVKAGGFQDADPGTVTGRAVSSTGQPIAGALFDLGGGLAGASGADGSFTIQNVPRGNYNATLSAASYVTQSYTIAYPPGALGNLGNLVLYAAATGTPPTTLNLTVTVVDGVTRAPIAGASVTLVDTGASVVTGADGRARLADLAIKSFNLTLSAAGYQAATYGFQASAFGDAQATLALSPPGDGAATSTLTGIVTDAVTLAPIPGARVAINGTNQSAMAAANGSYTLSAIGALDFTLTISAVGYSPVSAPMNLAAHGSYTLNPSLHPIAGTGPSLKLLSLTTDKPSYAAYAPVSIRLEALNSGVSPVSGSVNVTLLDAQGQMVESLQATHTDANGVEQSRFDFQPGVTLSITVPWNSAAHAPGGYAIDAKIMQADTNSVAGGALVVLAAERAVLGIDPTQAIGRLTLTPLPRFTSLGAVEQVGFRADVVNRSNVNTELGIAYQFLSPTGAVLYSGTATIPLVPGESTKSVVLNGLQHTFTESGGHPAQAQAVSGPVPAVIDAAAITVAPGTRIDPSQGITPATVTPDGDKRIRIDIRLKGVEQK